MTLTEPGSRLPASSAPVSIGGLVRQHRGALIVSALLAVIGAAASLAPYVAVYAVASALFGDEPQPEAIGPIAAWTAVALVVRAAANAGSAHVGHVAAYRVLQRMRLALVEHVRRLPLGAVQARSAGQTKKLFHDDVEQMEEALAHGVPDGAAAAAVPVVTTAVLFAFDWRLALVALASLVLLVAVSAIGMVLAQRNNAALAAHLTVLNRVVMGYLQGIRVIRSFLRRDGGYDGARDAVVEAARLNEVQTSGPLRWLVAAMMVATGFSVALLLPVAGARFLDGDIDLSTLVLFLLLSLGYLTPVIGLVGTLATVLTRIQLSAAAISELFAQPLLPEPERGRVPERADVTFEQVGFAYRDDVPVLTGIDLSVPAGGTLAVVGPTGSGKSTLARLLCRFYDVGSGSVRIGGIDVREIRSRDLARLVAFVQQDEYVFDATLLENIRIARPDATDAEVVAAGERAQLGEVVAALAQGWHTRLPGGGGTLSGGQRQRIAIARALLKDAAVIVLDEATASLDTLTERASLAAIAELTCGRTVISIAHRLATIRSADAIAVLEDGRLAGVGPHEELISQVPLYERLWRSYSAAAGWRLEPAESSDRPADAEVAGAREAGTADRHASEDPWTAAARTMVRPGLTDLSFGAQWRAMYGRSWPELLRRGVPRLVAEALVRGAPMVAVFLVVLSALGPATGQAPLDGQRLAWITTGLVAALLARLLASVWSNSLVWRLASRSKADLQLSVLDRLRIVPLGFFRRVEIGRVGSVVTNDAVMVDFQNVPQQVVGALVQPVYATAILLAIDWRLALAALAGMPLLWLLTVWADRIYARVFRDVFAAREEATAAVLEQARGAAVLRGNPGSSIATRYREAVGRLARASIAMSVRATPATSLGSIAIELGLVLLIVVGSGLYLAGSVSAAVLVLFLLLSLTIYQPISELTALAGYRRNQQQIASRVAQVWDAPVLAEPERPQRPDEHSVQLEDVRFRYEDGPEVIRGASLLAPAGAITAIVGRSGSGKTTLASLVSRHWDVNAGSVRIGGIDVRDIGSVGLVDVVAAVDQDMYLFDDTVRANLSLGRPGASDAELWEALAAAQVDDVVAALPDGLDTPLADGGTDLSGGQRQRLAIARALLKNAPVLILDEAVASVDPGTEDRIQRALAVLAAGRTVLVIAHRVSTVMAADQIVVLAEGAVAGAGTHAELLAGCAAYRDLLQGQADQTESSVDA